MEFKKFDIGDLVCLKSHPFNEKAHKIIISGEATMLSPIMVVSEILKAKHTNTETAEVSYFIKYKCIWFTSKIHRFIDAWVSEIDLKLYSKSNSLLTDKSIDRGSLVTLKTIIPESLKKKSSLNYEDNSISKGNNSTIINSLLTFLPPILQVLDISKHKHKLPIATKEGATIRIVSEWNVKCLTFDSVNQKMSEVLLPIETLQLVESIDENVLSRIEKTIANEEVLTISEATKNTLLVKPRHIAYRNGIYYLRAYDYIRNRLEEVEITSKQNFFAKKSPFKNTLPSFNIAANPSAATPKFITKEIIHGIENAKKNGNYVRIKYKNKNEILSHRSLKDFHVIEIKSLFKTEYYLEAYCHTRKMKRTFRIDRIQSLQELDLKI